jgi:hypothetical protein
MLDGSSSESPGNGSNEAVQVMWTQVSRAETILRAVNVTQELDNGPAIGIDGARGQASHLGHVLAVGCEEIVKGCAGGGGDDFVVAEQEALKATDDARDISGAGTKISETVSKLYRRQALQRISPVVQVPIDDSASFYVESPGTKSVPLRNHPLIEVIEGSS